MGVLTGVLVAAGVVLVAFAALHAYAQWTIRNIDRENADGERNPWLDVGRDLLPDQLDERNAA
jgi:hypothetical protein